VAPERERMGNTAASGTSASPPGREQRTPIPSHQWTLDRRAHDLGFGGLRAYLAVRYTHAAHSLPQLAAELGTSV
jgi:hypothetical protein